MLCSVPFCSSSKLYYNITHFIIVFQMATNAELDLAAASNRSAVQKDPWFIRVSDIDFHRAWKKKKQANQKLVIPKNVEPKKNAQMITNHKFNIAIDSKRSAVQKDHCVLPTSGVVHE